MSDRNSLQYGEIHMKGKWGSRNKITIVYKMKMYPIFRVLHNNKNKFDN